MKLLSFSPLSPTHVKRDLKLSVLIILTALMATCGVDIP